jgi:cytochrome c
MKYLAFVAGALLSLPVSSTLAVEGDATQGARVFRACAACHSLEAGKNMTGPSLSGVWNRKAGEVAAFPRFSDAMKQSGVTWNEETLDGYLKNPAQFMPGNHMTFPGIPDDKARADIIAFLKRSATAAADDDQDRAERQMPGAPGMSGQRVAPKLKNASASARIKSITYCHDTFTVTTQDGNSRKFWERNLRFKTDSSDEGPEKNAPAILAAGMMGDRASIIFASPEEISRAIEAHC